MAHSHGLLRGKFLGTSCPGQVGRRGESRFDSLSIQGFLIPAVKKQTTPHRAILSNAFSFHSLTASGNLSVGMHALASLTTNMPIWLQLSFSAPVCRERDTNTHHGVSFCLACQFASIMGEIPLRGEGNQPLPLFLSQCGPHSVVSSLCATSPS